MTIVCRSKKFVYAWNLVRSLYHLLWSLSLNEMRIYLMRAPNEISTYKLVSIQLIYYQLKIKRINFWAVIIMIVFVLSVFHVGTLICCYCFVAAVSRGAAICTLKSGIHITMRIYFQYVLTDTWSIVIICSAVVLYLFLVLVCTHPHRHITQYILLSTAVHNRRRVVANMNYVFISK